MRIPAIILASIWCLTVISGSFLSANAQQPSNRLPTLLIHGYAENSHVWDPWKVWLRDNGFDMTKVYSINFTNDVTFPNGDECGSVIQHATELRNIVNSILSATHSDKVNIVAHSKGGLDARWYIADKVANPVDKVANLIMIGTPNSGTTAEYFDWTPCAGFGSDLSPYSGATHAADRTDSTHYYTIAGYFGYPCYLGAFPFSNCLLPNDGLVTISSAQSSPYVDYCSLGEFPYNHAGLMTHIEVYGKILPILSGGSTSCGPTGSTSSFSPSFSPHF
jgi:pimeloyl-ACP methyl ester carboxylesterase